MRSLCHGGWTLRNLGWDLARARGAFRLDICFAGSTHVPPQPSNEKVLMNNKCIRETFFHIQTTKVSSTVREIATEKNALWLVWGQHQQYS